MEDFSMKLKAINEFKEYIDKILTEPQDNIIEVDMIYDIIQDNFGSTFDDDKPTSYEYIDLNENDDDDNFIMIGEKEETIDDKTKQYISDMLAKYEIKDEKQKVDKELDEYFSNEVDISNVLLYNHKTSHFNNLNTYLENYYYY